MPMFKTTRLAENLLLDIAENAEVGIKTRSIMKLAKNLSLLVDMAENAKVDEGGDGGDNKTVEKSLFSKSQTYL